MMIVMNACGCKSRSNRNLIDSIARGAVYLGNWICRSLPTTAPIGCLRKHTGCNEMNPNNSVERHSLNLDEVNWSVEPLPAWRRLERFIAGQETHMFGGWLGNQGRKSRFLPEDSGIGMNRLLGVPGMACAESIRNEPWEIQLESLTQ